MAEVRLTVNGRGGTYERDSNAHVDWTDDGCTWGRRVVGGVMPKTHRLTATNCNIFKPSVAGESCTSFVEVPNPTHSTVSTHPMVTARLQLGYGNRAGAKRLPLRGCSQNRGASSRSASPMALGNASSVGSPRAATFSTHLWKLIEKGDPLCERDWRMRNLWLGRDGRVYCDGDQTVKVSALFGGCEVASLEFRQLRPGETCHRFAIRVAVRGDKPGEVAESESQSPVLLAAPGEATMVGLLLAVRSQAEEVLREKAAKEDSIGRRQRLSWAGQETAASPSPRIKSPRIKGTAQPLSPTASPSRIRH